MFTALERLLTTERLRQRAAPNGGFSVPALHEVSLTGDVNPLLASNMKGSFLPTKVSAKGLARYGFSHIPVGADDVLLRELHRTLYALSIQENWTNRCKSIREAQERLQSFSLEVKTLIVGPSRLAEIAPGLSLQDAWAEMRRNSAVAIVEDITVLLADLPEGAALVATAPSLVGSYTRVGSYLGVLLRSVHRNIVVVT